MIPKIIHLCWLSGDPFPKDIRRCLETWNDKLKGYTIWLWGKAPEDISVIKDLQLEVKEFDLNSIDWTKQAFEAKKYAFAADYIRLYALYTYGGIYLDADVLIYKSFDDLLHLPYFIGCDQIGAFEAAVIGCETDCKWIKDIFNTYIGKTFIMENGSYDMLPLPIVFHHVLVELNYRFRLIHKVGNIMDINQEKQIYVLDGDFFNSRNEVEVRRTDKSFCAHNYAGSWQKKTFSIKSFIPKKILKIMFIVSHNTYNKNKFKWFQIPFEK